MKVKKTWRHHLLYDDVINFFLTRKCQKTRKIEVSILNEKISIPSEQPMKFSGKTWLNIKSHKKTRLHPLSRICKFGTSYNYCKNLKWKKPFQDFRVFDFGYRAKFLSQFTFCRFWIIRYNNCQNLKLGNAFRDILVFYFGYRANWRLRNFANFLFFF